MKKLTPNQIKTLQNWEGQLSEFCYLNANVSSVGSHMRNGNFTKSQYDKKKEQLPPELARFKSYDFSDVVYQFNSLGFRCDEFDKNDKRTKILFLGCSFTEGEGVRKEDTWSWKFKTQYESHTNQEIGYYILAAAGWGADRIIRSLYLLINDYGFVPDYVVFLSPPALREDFYANDFDFSEFARPYGALPKRTMYDDPACRLFETHRNNMVRQKNLLFKYQTQIILLNTICKLHSIKYVWGYWDNSNFYQDVDNEILPISVPVEISEKFCANAKFPFPEEEFSLIRNPSDVDIALDYMHPGPNHHSVISIHMFEKFKNAYL